MRGEPKVATKRAEYEVHSWPIDEGAQLAAELPQASTNRDTTTETHDPKTRTGDGGHPARGRLDCAGLDRDEADCDPEVKSIMLANDRLAGQLEQTIEQARQSGAHSSGQLMSYGQGRRLDYDLGLLGQLVGETIIRLPLMEEDYERGDEEEENGQPVGAYDADWRAKE